MRMKQGPDNSVMLSANQRWDNHVEILQVAVLGSAEHRREHVHQQLQTHREEETRSMRFLYQRNDEYYSV